jgi:GT2 family glycosyltransferase
LGRALAHLDAQSAPAAAFAVVVAADAAVRDLDGLAEVTSGRPYATRLLQAGRPGASAARNTGWRAVESELVLFIDDDILPGADLVAEHLAWHERHPAPEVGVLGHVRWADELPVTPFMRWLEHGIQFNYPSITGTETVWGNFYTANVSVKRAVVAHAGGFDEERLPYGYEDLDLSLRMHRTDGFRLLYNRRAEVEHLHPMDLDFWRRRVRRIAVSERRFVALHPEIPAYFHDMFSDAVSRPRAAGHGARLARVVPRRVPLLGPLVWSRADLFYRQALAGPFLEAWGAAGQDAPSPDAPTSSGGSPPGGPK